MYLFQSKKSIQPDHGMTVIAHFCATVFFIVAFDSIVQAQADDIFRKETYRQTMSQRWELDSADRRKTFVITPYKPIYITAGRWSSSPNTQPKSGNPAYSLPFPVAYNNYEAKFQLSLKTKVLQRIFWGRGDVWVAYTQKAHWQVYNVKLSRPFRELNYEPEIILNFATNFSLLGFKTRVVGVALTHQSNGRILPLSRSWNRVIFHAGFERKNWQVYVRPWVRLPDKEDENPDITDYIGAGDVTVVRAFGRHQVSVVGTHSLRFTNTWGRGSIQGNWVFPISGNFKGLLQVSEGYGETLVDYNHRQTTIGVSVSLVEW
ncbi:MAG: phospholipase A [Chitinophagaceae bacterium]